jgi:hypothetical protein
MVELRILLHYLVDLLDLLPNIGLIVESLER